MSPPAAATAADYQQTYDLLCAHARETALLKTVQSALEWDERTKLPPAAGDYRAEQLAYLAGRLHQQRTAPQVGEWLADLAYSPLAADPHSDTGAVILRMKRDYDKKAKLPQSLVEELAVTAAKGQHIWAAARKADDFEQFAPILKKMIGLKRDEANALGFDDDIYDPLLDDYEPGQTTANVEPVLLGLAEALVPLIQAIGASPRKPKVDLLKRRYPIDAQEAFGKNAAAAIGFDFNSGRLDVTDHPFCTELGPRDTRLTTRYDEHFFPDGFFSILHEAGHGIYQQGLPDDRFGLPTGEAVSLGIHESQSQLWEKLVGHHRAFWEFFYPAAQAAFPEPLSGVPLDEFHFAINDVRPSLIRTDADEATYNLHVVVRFELERALLEGNLSVGDLPGAWNEKYRQYLGIDPPNMADGVLQDVHWSAGLFGYFPTYALGNIYSAQLLAAAARDLGDLTANFRRGEFGPLREWLVANIYRQGRRYDAGELARRATGEGLSHKALIEHLTSRFGELYAL